MKEISTSALAKKLAIPSKDCFASLEASSLIKRMDDYWKITEKGTYIG